MAIAKDNSRNTYYITSQLKAEGWYKTCKIRNSAWRIKGDGKVTLSYMRSIEHRLVEEDKRRRGNSMVTGREMNLLELEDRFYTYLRSEYIDDDTIRSYEYTYKNHLHTCIDPYESVSKALTLSKIDSFKAELASKGFKPRTVNNKLVAVKKMVDFAKRRKFMNRETADEIVDALHPIRENDEGCSSTNFFEDPRNDALKFFETFNEADKDWLLPVQVLFYGAFRIGEFLAIKVRDCNFSNCTISVSKQIDSHGNEKEKTKGRKSRLVHIPKECMERVYVMIGEKFLSKDDFLFPSQTGHHMLRKTIRSKVDKHLQMAGLRHITLHGLRHSFASLMFESGFAQTAVQAQLGHARLSTTNDYYIHLTKSQEDKSFDELGIENGDRNSVKLCD